MRKKFFLCLLVLLFTAASRGFSQVNLGFESGITGWTRSGTTNIDITNMMEGTKCIKIGSGFGGIFQNVSTEPLAILWFEAYIKVSNSSNSGYLVVRFYDHDSVLIMEQKSQAVTNTSYQERNIYTETPANTEYLKIGIESSSSNAGFVYGDTFSKVFFTAGFENTPQCNLDKYLKPFWSADTIYSETILMYQKNGATQISGKLLFTPENIISVRSFDQMKVFVQGTDFILNGRTLLKTSSSAMPYTKESDLDFADYNWNILQSKWITITYVPDRSDWKGPTFGYKGDKMLNLMQKLRNKELVTIVALGMSITRGLNVSGYGGDNNIPACAPYMPGYVSLFAYELQKIYGYNDITVMNASLPGSTSDWAAKYADKYVNPYQPDLVILDMGMNDFWSYNASTFKAYMQAAIVKIKADCPDAEFLLLSNMLFDPEYLTDPVTLKNYTDRMKGYNTALQSMETDGIIDLDMTTMSDSIYRRKKPKDCVVNPLHPNDYLARWYAQGMVALLDSSSQLVESTSEKAMQPDFFTVYPNPVSKGTFSFNISIPNSKIATEISIYDITGKLVTEFLQNIGTKEYSALEFEMTKGIYIIEAQQGTTTVSKRILIN
jgi:lysophospholipase L1-like esterase